MELARINIIACITVMEVTLPLFPPELQAQTLARFRIHTGIE